MTYKSKFEASEHRAHYQNIATKILREMSVLRSLVESSPIAPRRWVWELIQNAKDVHYHDGVKIEIDYQPKVDQPFISFKHNGKPFTADNIRFLIEQISTKDRKKDEDGKRKTTGKFGTGFLTTHLLSEIVKVKGVAKEPELDYRKFEMELDRTGFEIEQITDAVQTAKISVQDLDESPVFSEYKEGAFNTEFYYPLSDSVSQKVAKSGLDDLSICLPYTFAFVQDISTVNLVSSNQLFSKSNSTEILNENLRIVHIEIKDTNTEAVNIISVVIVSNGLTQIAIPIKKENEEISIQEIHEQTPKLFCDFPLIGAERFQFPAIINNPNFNPTDPRDGIFLTTPQRTNPLIEDNKAIINEAVNLYFILLEYAIGNHWKNLHLLAKIKPIFEVPDWIDESWFNKNALNPIREKLLYANIITSSKNELISILTSDDKKYAWFPNSSSKETRNQIWVLANYWFPHCLPLEKDIELWHKLTWKDCGKLDLSQLSAFVSGQNTIGKLTKCIKGVDVYNWLNSFYVLLKSDEKEYATIVSKYEIFPNQNGDLIKLTHLKTDNGDIGDEFKDILKLLGNDIRNELLCDKIDFEIEDVWDKNYAVREITTEINEKASDREVAKSYSPAFKKLLLWFQEHKEQAKLLFPNLYRNKHLLYDDDEILDNINKAEQLADLLKDCNASSIAELKELIAKGQNNNANLLPITQEILVSMGISSPEEWAEAIKDKNLAAIFSHESIPTTDMFVYVQSLIKQAKENIIAQLATLENYDISELDDTTATTILGGIKKDGQDVSIVARPAYQGEVIIYYGSERDILDFEPSELWIDDGVLPRKISLGHILKKAQIIKFPV